MIAITLIELLVVIAIIGLLIALVTAVASKAIGQQKVRNTQQIMQNVMLAIEQFATEDPLGEAYAETFGSYPPYQLANCRVIGSVARALEDLPPAPRGTSRDNLLSDRLARDLGCPSAGEKDAWVVIGPETDPPPTSGYPDGHDDARALYAYLKLFSPDSLRLIPGEYSKPLYPQLPAIGRSYVNSRGQGTQPGDPGAEDVLAIHDAWGVPLDYMLYVKLECGFTKDPITGIQQDAYRVVERRPALRSRGIEREVYDQWVNSNRDEPTRREPRLSPADKWLFSEPFCSPAAGLTDDQLIDDGYVPYRYRRGMLPGSLSLPSSANGWARAVAAEEDYAYLPAGDVKDEEP